MVAAQPHASQLHTQDLHDNSIGAKGATVQAAALPHALQQQTQDLHNSSMGTARNM
jgi:hypothetical protein